MKHHDEDPGPGWLERTVARTGCDPRFEYGQGRAFCEALARHGPWLLLEARKLTGGNKERARWAVRRALGRLWEWDVTRFNGQSDEYIRRALLTAMRMSLHDDRRKRRHARVRLSGRRGPRGYFASVRGMELE